MEEELALNEILSNPYEPDWDNLSSATAEYPFLNASFYLLTDCATLVGVAASQKVTNPESLHNAILLGMTVKIAKLLSIVARDMSNNETYLSLTLARQILETSANLQWLMSGNDDKRYDMYIQDGLVAEKVMLSDIFKNIKSRGQEIHIEKRMKSSINEVGRAAGINDISTLPSREKIGLPKIEDRMKSLGDNAYFAYRSLSSEVHGTWTELFHFHLTRSGNAFEPNFDNPKSYAQIPSSLVGIVSSIMPNYLRITASDVSLRKLEPLFDALNDKQKRFVKLHEAYLEKSNKSDQNLDTKSNDS